MTMIYRSETMITEMKKMKKILQRLTGWLVKKTDYVPQLPMPVQPIIIKPEDLQHFKAQKAVSKYEWYNRKVEPDYYVRTLKYEVAEKFVDLMQIKADETPDYIIYSVDLLFKNLVNN